MAKKISSLRGLRGFSSWFNKDEISNKLLDSLIEEGKYIMKQAYELRTWNNKTYNLHDSYVAVVFMNGKAVRSAHFTPKSKTPRNYGEDKDGGFAVTGADEIRNFIKSYNASHSNEKGVKLVVAATMFYSGILEAKGYQVISSVSSEFDRLKSQGVRIKMKSYNATAPDIKIPDALIRTRDIAEGGRTFKGF